MSQNESQNVQVTLTVPQEFYNILEEIAKSFDQSVEEYIIDGVISGLDGDLQESVGSLLGLKERYEYYDQLRALISGGTA